MNSVRPLVTITVLGLVAWFLYVKINQGALRPGPAPAETAQSLAPALSPPLSNAAAVDKPAAADTRAAAGNVAPQWPSTSATGKSAEHNPKASKIDVPAIPDLPELPTAPDLAVSSAAPAANANSLATAPPLPPVVGTTSEAPAAREQDSAAQDAMKLMGLSPSQPSESPAGVLPPFPAAPPVAGGDNRYGLSAAAPTTPPAGSPATASGAIPSASASFAASWPAIQAALGRGELARAHQMLSPWFGDPSLTPAEAQRVETLLGQLAGTVIYSTEHRLEPPYTVKTGDTLESIAKQLEVPWQLLAKINGIAALSQIRPGQQLKVVRGPFAAMVDLRRNQLALMVDGRYAGKFPVSVPVASNLPTGEWIVADKPVTPAAATSVYATPGSLAAAPPTRSILLRATAGDAAKLATQVRIAADSADPRIDSGLKAPLLVKVSPRDADELSDILSIGSRVIIQR